MEESKHVVKFASRQGGGVDATAMRARFDVNLREALVGVGRKAPDRLAVAQACPALAGKSDAQIKLMVDRFAAGQGSEWHATRGGDPTSPRMKAAASLLREVRDALAAASPDGGAPFAGAGTDSAVYKPAGRSLNGPQMLGWLGRTYSGGDDGAMTTWRRPEVGASVEALVREHAAVQGLSAGEAAGKLEAAIQADDSGLHPMFASKLLALTAAVREEESLGTKLAGHAAFSGLASGDAWRLLAPAQDQRNADRWDADSANQGSLAGMMRGFGRMVDAHDRHEPVTADSLVRLHATMTEGTWKSGIAIDPSMEFPVGLRDDQGTDLGLEGGRVITDAGRAELKLAAAKDDWFKLTEDQDDDGSAFLTFASKSADETRARAVAILDVYRKDIGAATTDSEKRLAVAKATQDLYRSHLFQDGNTRTVVFATMNRLLLDAGLDPAILPEPRAAAGFSLREFAAEVEKGQAAFQALKGRGEVVEAADLVPPAFRPGIPSELEFRQAADGSLTGTRRLRPEDVSEDVIAGFNDQLETVSRADGRLAETGGSPVTHQCWRDFDRGGMRVTVGGGDGAPTFAKALPGSDDFRPAALELLGTTDRLAKASRFLEQSPIIALNRVLIAALGRNAAGDAVGPRMQGVAPEVRMALVGGDGDDKAVEFTYRYTGKPVGLLNVNMEDALPLLQERSSVEASATIRIKVSDLDAGRFGEFTVADGPRANATVVIDPNALPKPGGGPDPDVTLPPGVYGIGIPV